MGKKKKKGKKKKARRNIHNHPFLDSVLHDAKANPCKSLPRAFQGKGGSGGAVPKMIEVRPFEYAPPKEKWIVQQRSFHTLQRADASFVSLVNANYTASAPAYLRFLQTKGMCGGLPPTAEELAAAAAAKKAAAGKKKKGKKKKGKKKKKKK